MTDSDFYSTLIGGDYYLDYLILSKLSIDNILVLVNHGEYFSPICVDNYFWYLVANYHFPGVVPTAGTTWFHLIDFLTSAEVKNLIKDWNYLPMWAILV